MSSSSCIFQQRNQLRHISRAVKVEFKFKFKVDTEVLLGKFLNGFFVVEELGNVVCQPLFNVSINLCFTWYFSEVFVD